ncbi:hypothetical protein BDV96DRAFT_644619 [Lophiotrema nucula]|uniref:Uncharacterized protein n=1 Tax=Lophiotrema nucula TaxID=690887 RepID=A0A6A5ZFQ2_9PLEO|nr:hypothetical protein BDV96DRAFT_644619 [Lophiotrema nucula]
MPATQSEHLSRLSHSRNPQRVDLPEDYRDPNHPLHPGDVEAQQDFKLPPEPRRVDKHTMRNTICYVLLASIFLTLLALAIMSGIAFTRRKTPPAFHPLDVLEPTTEYITRVVTLMTQLEKEDVTMQRTRTVAVTMTSQGKSTDELVEF